MPPGCLQPQDGRPPKPGWRNARPTRRRRFVLGHRGPETAKLAIQFPQTTLTVVTYNCTMGATKRLPGHPLTPPPQCCERKFCQGWPQGLNLANGRSSAANQCDNPYRLFKRSGGLRHCTLSWPMATRLSGKSPPSPAQPGSLPLAASPDKLGILFIRYDHPRRHTQPDRHILCIHRSFPKAQCLRCFFR